MLDLGNGDGIHIDNKDQTNANGFDRNDVFNSSPISSFEFDDVSMSAAANDAHHAAQPEWRKAA